MTTIDLNALDALARAIIQASLTGGQWRYEDDYVIMEGEIAHLEIPDTHLRYIAAANPLVVLELIERLRKAEAELAACRQVQSPRLGRLVVRPEFPIQPEEYPEDNED